MTLKIWDAIPRLRSLLWSALTHFYSLGTQDQPIHFCRSSLSSKQPSLHMSQKETDDQPTWLELLGSK